MDKAEQGPAGAALAEAYRSIRSAGIRSGRLLHDQVGPLLSAAALHLQLLRMDHPETGTALQPVTALLDQAMERVRAVSQELAPSPVLRGGLKNALLRLVETVAEQHPGTVAILDYAATAAIPEEPACALYDAAAGAIAQAVGSFGARQVQVSVRGSRSLSIRITDHGKTRGRSKALAGILLVAGVAGISGTVATGKSTIVSFRYAFRRSLSGRS